MSIVYVVQEPFQRVGSTIAWRIPRESLERYGEIVCLTTWRELQTDNRLGGDFSPERCTQLYRAMMPKLARFSDADYLAPLGNPVLIAMATIIASRQNAGRVRMLDWVRDAGAYRVATIDAFCSPSFLPPLASRPTPR